MYTEQYSQWLSAYLDGELEPHLEEPLFSALASDSELRQELRELLALRRAARKDAVALLPPLSTTAAVFQSVGIGMGTATIAHLMQKLWLPFASAITGGVLTWLGMTLLGPTPPTSVQQYVTSKHGTFTSSSASSSQQPTVVERVVYRTRTIYEPTPTSSPPRNDEAPSPNFPATTPLTTQQTFADEVAQFSSSVEPFVVRRFPISISPTDYAAQETLAFPEHRSELFPHFRLQIRGLGTTSLVNVPQQPDRTSLLNTSAIGLLYTLNEHHAVGIEVGREPYAMRFYGYNANTRLRYEAYPSLLWGTATYQYRTRWSNNLEPFVQLGVGGTEFGFLARATVGLLYQPASSLGAFIGIDGSLVRYVYQSVPYVTPNVGITYGIMFRF